MAYLGVQPLKGQNRKLDNISAGFNGGNVTFNLATGGAALTPATAYQLFISVGGVLQDPGVDFTVNGNQITFTTAPATGLSFFGLYQGDAIDSVSVSDGAITSAKLATGLTVTLGAGSTSTPSVTFAGDTNTGIYSPAADTIGFVEGGVEAMRIDSSGRLLVGTSTAVGSFNYAGGSRTPQIQLSGSSVDAGSLAVIRTATGPVFFFGAGTSGTDVAVNNGLGYLSCHGYHTNGYYEGARISAEVDGTPGANDMPGRLIFSTTADGASSPTERMRIGQNGTILIGITTAYSGNGITLSPTGSSTIRNQTTGTQEAFGVSTGTYDPAFFVKGNGGINNYSTNNVNLSDRNAKKDISPAADTWDCIKEWEIVNYRYKDQPDDADLNLGVIAQQVAESCPEVITVFQEAKEATEDQPAQEERLGVKEQQMYWMAIKALQEAQVRIEQLEQRLTDAGIA